MTGCILWFTGLSASGKTTLCLEVERRLTAEQIPCVVLDGDRLRQTISQGLGFTRADREENVRRIEAMAREHATAGSCVLVAAIAPYRAQREALRAQSAVPFFEIFVDAPLSVCEQRDPKGLYRKARAGLIPHFTGIDDPYEAPLAPDLHCFTSVETVQASCQKVLLLVAPELTT